MMMRFGDGIGRKAALTLGIVLLGLALAACGGRKAAPAQEPTAAPPTSAPAETAPAETPAEAAPAAETPAATPKAQPESPLARAPESPLAQPNVSPLATSTSVPRVETAPGTGAVTGVLLVRSEQGEVPVAGMIIAVADALTSTENAGAIAAFRYRAQESPQTNTGENGFFVISNVPPGRYGLVLDLVATSYILRKPGVNEDLVITVEPDAQVDLGPLVYNELPLPTDSQ
ncbi:MAG: hypothetical protein IT329_00065 [Caldilineaceae bacterium]|nr:hypothetical protein [Caldilineaceae bacterium]